LPSKNWLSKEDYVECSVSNHIVFEDTYFSLPTPILASNFLQNQDALVPKVLQYKKYFQNTTPVEIYKDNLMLT
jgi:hypothetical protein